MQQREFALLVRTGVIDRVVIYRDRRDGQTDWSVWAYAADDSDATTGTWAIKNCIEAARGGRREWTNVHSAYTWIREQGWKSEITIDESGLYD